MSEDPLLRELGHLARDENELVQARFDERWDRLAAGTLTAEEDAELRALAAASPEARAAYEAFRPLGPDFQSRLVDTLSSEVGARAPRVEPRRRSPSFPAWRRVASWGTGAAAAAAAALFLLLRGLGPAAVLPLPTYVAELSGGTRELRGEDTPPDGPKELAPGDRFRIVLRPATKTPGEDLEAHCFLLRGSEPRGLETEVEVDPDGAVKIEGSIGRDLPPGDWTLWAVVGRGDELPEPTAPRFVDARDLVRQRDWVAVPTEIRILPGSR